MDYFQELELTPGTATEREINSAYKRLALRYHPDKNPGDEAAHLRFLRIREAHQALLDPTIRQSLEVKRKAQAAQAARRERDDEGRRRMREELLRRESEAKTAANYQAELSRQRGRQAETAWWQEQAAASSRLVRLLCLLPQQPRLSEAVVRELIRPHEPTAVYIQQHGSVLIQMPSMETVQSLLAAVNTAPSGSPLADYAAEAVGDSSSARKSVPVPKPAPTDVDLEALEEKVLGRLLRLEQERKQQRNVN